MKKTFTSQNNVMKLKDDYSSLISKFKCRAKHGKGLKVLTPKQMFGRFPTAFAQVKALNTSENVLNEIRQIT